jgi:hypothetical protein
MLSLSVSLARLESLGKRGGNTGSVLSKLLKSGFNADYSICDARVARAT